MYTGAPAYQFSVPLVRAGAAAGKTVGNNAGAPRAYLFSSSAESSAPDGLAICRRERAAIAPHLPEPVPAQTRDRAGALPEDTSGLFAR